MISIFKNIFPIALLLVFGLWPSSAKAQDSCVYLFSIPQNVHFATSDHFANSYLSYGFEVEKFDSTGHSVARYSNNRLGTAASMDASNPLKVLLWYADFQTAVFLDRNMTELGRLNLAQAGFPTVRCLASAADGNLWAYDEASSQLLKLSTAGEKLLGSQPLYFELSARFAPTCIRDDGGQAVLLSDPTQGVAVFDPFAQLNRILPFEGLKRFEVENGFLFFVEKDEVYVENWRGLSSKTIPLPPIAQLEGGVLGISKNRLFVQTKGGVAVYRF